MVAREREREYSGTTPIKVALTPICVGGATNCLIKDHENARLPKTKTEHTNKNAKADVQQHNM